jgi:hypothetical protein
MYGSEGDIQELRYDFRKALHPFLRTAAQTNIGSHRLPSCMSILPKLRCQAAIQHLRCDGLQSGQNWLSLQFSQ